MLSSVVLSGGGGGGDGENRGMGGKVIGGRGKDEVIGVLCRCVRATHFCVFKMKALS